MKLLKAVLGLSICAGLTLLSAPATPLEVVTELVLCPETAPLRLNWKNKIGEKPSFEAAHPGDIPITAAFSKKTWAGGQVFTCFYVLRDSTIQGIYNHRYSRKVIGCKDKDARTWECTLEKK